MNAAEVIDGLTRAGVALKDAIAKIQPGDRVDYGALFQTVVNDPDLNRAVDEFLEAIKGNDVEAAIDEMAAKQTALLKGRDVSRLTLDEFLQYSDLVTARLLLATAATAGLGPRPWPASNASDNAVRVR